MKILFVAVILLIVGLAASAQRGDHLRLTTTADSVGPNTFELHLKATLDDGWHVYAQAQPGEAIAQPTEIAFVQNPLLRIAASKPKEIGHKETYKDPTAGIVQYQYAHEVDFVQLVTRKGKAKTTVNGTFTYQICTNDMCLPPKTILFTVALP